MGTLTSVTIQCVLIIVRTEWTEGLIQESVAGVGWGWGWGVNHCTNRVDRRVDPGVSSRTLGGGGGGG